MNWIEARSALRGRKSRKVGNNTYMEQDEVNPETVHLRLHSTRIITWEADGTIKLNSGGWRTVTTKKRMNDYTPFTVYQKDHEWYVCRWGVHDIPFEDGMVLKADGLSLPTED